MAQVTNSFFPSFNCYFESEKIFPLIVEPRFELQKDFFLYANGRCTEIASAVKAYGAVVFRNFNIDKDNFSQAFQAAMGYPPQKYKGDTPRDEINFNVYKSTAVANGRAIPLHQEVSGGARSDMPKYISFFCVTPPAPGTGRTLLGSAKEVTEIVKKQMPELWQAMTKYQLTYTSRYMPKGHPITQWIQWLNPSHATIEKRFGTENKEAVEAQCRQEGLSCTWDNGWAVIKRSGVPATIDIDGATLFCNQIHVDKFNAKLVGGGLNYTASTILYPQQSCLQFDVEFEGGPKITAQQASQLLAILETHEVSIDWKQGDLLLVDNFAMMHGKTPHEGPREIIVAMGGAEHG